MRATADRVSGFLHERDREKFFRDFPEAREQYAVTDEDKRIAELALDWARGLADSAEPLNDYLYNLNTIAKPGALSSKHFGLACSIIPAYNRVVEREFSRQRQVRNSQHFGTIKKRDVFTLTVTRHNSFEGNYGVTHIYGFEDPTGNVACWFASTPQDLEVGSTYRIKATVKNHDAWKGIAQTTLTRGDVQEKVTEEPAAAAA